MIIFVDGYLYWFPWVAQMSVNVSIEDASSRYVLHIFFIFIFFCSFSFLYIFLDFFVLNIFLVYFDIFSYFILRIIYFCIGFKGLYHRCMSCVTMEFQLISWLYLILKRDTSTVICWVERLQLPRISWLYTSTCSTCFWIWTGFLECNYVL